MCFASYAGVLPRLDLTASFGHDFVGARSAVTAFPTRLDPASGVPVFEQRVVPLPSTDNANYALGLTLQLPLFDGGRSWRTIERAGVAARGAERTLDESALAVAFEVTRRFYEVVKAQESLRVLEETVVRSEGFLRRSQALFEAGRGGRLDVLTAQGNLGNDRIAVEQARARARADARRPRASSLGREAGDALVVVAPAALDRPLAAREPPAEGALRRACPARAAAPRRRAEDVRGSPSSAQDLARGAWFPTVGAQATLQPAGPHLRRHRRRLRRSRRGSTSASAQLVLQWNLFNGRQTQADEQRAALATRRARAQAAQAEQQVSGEIARARSSRHRARPRGRDLPPRTWARPSRAWRSPATGWRPAWRASSRSATRASSSPRRSSTSSRRAWTRWSRSPT